MLLYSEETALGLKLHRMIQLDETFSVSEKLDKVFEEIAGDQIDKAFCIMSSQKSFIVLAEDATSRVLLYFLILFTLEFLVNCSAKVFD